MTYVGIGFICQRLSFKSIPNMGSVFAGLIVKNRYVRAQFLKNLVASNRSVNAKWPEFVFSSLDYCPSVGQPHGILIMQMSHPEYKTKVFHDEMQKKKPLF